MRRFRLWRSGKYQISVLSCNILIVLRLFLISNLLLCRDIFCVGISCIFLSVVLFRLEESKSRNLKLQEELHHVRRESEAVKQRYEEEMASRAYRETANTPRDR